MLVSRTVCFFCFFVATAAFLMKGFCSTDKHRVINYVKLSWRDCSIIQSDILTFDATSNNTVLEMQPKPQNHSHLKWLWTGLEDESSYMCFLKKKKKKKKKSSNLNENKSITI